MHYHILSSLIYFILFASFGLCGGVGQTIIVDQSGKGNFTTVQAAIDFVPSGNSRWIRIQINPGNYTEQVTIAQDKWFIFLKGSGINQTIISSSSQSQQISEPSTFAVSANNFVAKGIRFENTFDHPVPVNDDAPFHRAVAVYAQGDKISFYKCAFVSVQDTLRDDQGRHYYKGCYIQGLVDFIWGAGQSVYEDCSINVYKLPPPEISHGYITAQARGSSSDPGGYVFIGGSIYGGGVALLGRAYRAYSRVVFIGTTMSVAVDPVGWDAAHYKGHKKNLFFAEANCTGDGANLTSRVTWDKINLTDQELSQFSRETFIDQDGWIGLQPQN